MKVLAVQGSPRTEGNTATLLHHYICGLKEAHENAEIELLNLSEKEIQSCNGCNSCTNSERTCVIKDDMQEIYKDVLNANMLILASPIYWWNITAQAKQFFDRLYALDHDDDLKGKKFVLLTTYEGEDPNSGPVLVRKIFDDICDYVGMDFIQSYGVCSGEVSVDNNLEAKNKAFELGKTCLK